jgi:alpha-D-xyloside xylohydrolase
MGSVEDRPDYDYTDGVTFHTFELADGAEVSTLVPSEDGDTAMELCIGRTGKTITATPKGASGPWSILLHGITSVASVQAGTSESEGHGVRVTPTKPGATIAVILD